MIGSIGFNPIPNISLGDMEAVLDAENTLKEDFEGGKEKLDINVEDIIRQFSIEDNNESSLEGCIVEGSGDDSLEEKLENAGIDEIDNINMDDSFEDDDDDNDEIDNINMDDSFEDDDDSDDEDEDSDEIHNISMDDSFEDDDSDDEDADRDDDDADSYDEDADSDEIDNINMDDSFEDDDSIDSIDMEHELVDSVENQESEKIKGNTQQAEQKHGSAQRSLAVSTSEEDDNSERAFRIKKLREEADLAKLEADLIRKKIEAEKYKAEQERELRKIQSNRDKVISDEKRRRILAEIKRREQLKALNSKNNDEKESKIDYSSLDIDSLYKEVRNFLKANNIEHNIVDVKVLESRFGKSNIKKLIIKSYLISIGKGVTIGR